MPRATRDDTYGVSSNSSSRLRCSALKLSSEISHKSVSPRGPLVAATPSRLSTASGEASRALFAELMKAPENREEAEMLLDPTSRLGEDGVYIR